MFFGWAPRLSLRKGGGGLGSLWGAWEIFGAGGGKAYLKLFPFGSGNVHPPRGGHPVVMGSYGRSQKAHATP